MNLTTYRNTAAAVLIVGLLAAGVCGCKDRTSSSEDSAAPSVSSAELLVLIPAVGIGPVKFGATTDEILKYFGEPDKPQTDNMSLDYVASRGLSFLIHPTRGLWKVDCWAARAVPEGVVSKDFPGSTDKGVRIGASRSEIENRHGEPDNVVEQGQFTILNYAKQGMLLTLEDGRLSGISISSQK